MREHCIYCHVMQHGWSVTFAEGQERIGPWLLCDGNEEVERILRWGHATPDDLEKYRDDLRRWGVAGCNLNLTRLQRASLIARGLGWPWNGYELGQMKAAGRYPPERLTLAQEANFVRRRRRK